MSPHCNCGVIDRAPDAHGWRWCHAVTCPAYTQPLPPVSSEVADLELELANAGWISRAGGWVYPDLDTGDPMPIDEALRIERGWRDHDQERMRIDPHDGSVHLTPAAFVVPQLRDRRPRSWRTIILACLAAFLIAAAAAFVLVSMFEAAGYAASPVQSAKTSPHKAATISSLRAAARWNHSVVVDLNQRIHIANGTAGGGRDLRACHTLHACRTLAAQQKASRIWAEEAWSRLRSDNSAAGAMRIVRYRFHPCGRVAQARAHLIVGWESSWQRFNINGAGDTSWWQIELGSSAPGGHGANAHPEVSVAQAEDAWESTGIAVRWSDCGRNFSPTWTSVRDHGMDWP